MTKTVLLAGAAALAFSGAAYAGASHPSLSGKEGVNAKHILVLPPHNGAVLYDQSAGSNGVGIVSQEFTDFTGGQYDAQGADDFTVPAGKTWTITDVVANGVYFNGAGPADGFNVTFYKKIKGAKEKIKASCSDASYTDLNGIGGVDVNCGAKLKGGAGGHTYSVSVQAVMAFGSGGEWGWNTNNNVAGKAALWKNAGDGFATGCTVYTTLTTCIAASEGGDFAFAIDGSSN